MEEKREYVNGKWVCKYDGHQLAELNRNFEVLNKQNEAKEKWMQEYINRTMPIKSHFWVLIASLSILAGFAAIMNYIQRLHL